MLLHFLNLRWREGYRFFSEVPPNVITRLEDVGASLQRQAGDEPEVHLHTIGGVGRVGTLFGRVYLNVDRRKATYQHSIVIPPGEAASEELFQTLFDALYGRDKASTLPLLYNLLATRDYREGTPLVRALCEPYRESLTGGQPWRARYIAVVDELLARWPEAAEALPEGGATALAALRGATRRSEGVSPALVSEEPPLPGQAGASVHAREDALLSIGEEDDLDEETVLGSPADGLSEQDTAPAVVSPSEAPEDSRPDPDVDTAPGSTEAPTLDPEPTASPPPPPVVPDTGRISQSSPGPRSGVPRGEEPPPLSTSSPAEDQPSGHTGPLRWLLVGLLAILAAVAALIILLAAAKLVRERDKEALAPGEPVASETSTTQGPGPPPSSDELRVTPEPPPPPPEPAATSGDPTCSPRAEIPGDGVDQDCDQVDSCYVDADGDGYGSRQTRPGTSLRCSGSGESRQTGDCDDRRADMYPGAAEPCDGVDNDCAEGVDNGWPDRDGDRTADCAEQDPCPGGIQDRSAYKSLHLVVAARVDCGCDTVKTELHYVGDGALLGVASMKPVRGEVACGIPLRETGALPSGGPGPCGGFSYDDHRMDPQGLRVDWACCYRSTAGQEKCVKPPGAKGLIR